jgi:outer membrane protein assembly factor BamB
MCVIIKGKKKMTNKKTTTAISMLLILTFAISLIALPTTTADSFKETYAYIQPMDNPIGVGQQVLLYFGITDPMAWPQTGWTGLTVTVTKPDGTVETLGPFATDTTGGTGHIYVPTMTGTYYFEVHFPEQVLTTLSQSVPAGTVMRASDSGKVPLNVTQEPIPYYPSMPLPTEYWTRPINDQLREWATIGGNYLIRQLASRDVGPTSMIRSSTTGPESSHILWTYQQVMGGIAGGDVATVGQTGSSLSYSDGSAYEGKWSAFMIGGNYYRNAPYQAQSAYQTVTDINAHTGEQKWVLNNTRIAFGQLMYWNTFNMQGAFAYLWDTDPNRTAQYVLPGAVSSGTALYDPVYGNIWKAYDAYTGAWEYTMTNVPNGTMVYGPSGELLIYTVDQVHGYMTMWNSSNVPALYNNPDPNAAAFPYNWASWRPYGKTVNATAPFPITANTKNALPTGYSGYTWNVSIPKGLPGSPIKIRGNFTSGEYIMLGSTSTSQSQIRDPLNFWAINLKPGQEGTLLWNKTYPIEGNQTWTCRDASADDDVFVLASRETREFNCYSLSTGEKLWGPTAPQEMLDWIGFAQTSWPDLIAYGKLYSGTYSGIMHCYDVKTGKLLWTYTSTDDYSESRQSANWPMNIQFVADGKIYIATVDHSTNDPRPRDEPLICLNATTGDLIWKTPFEGVAVGGGPENEAILGDGIMVYMNLYDERDYAFGKGPSAITVEAPLASVTQGNSITIQGTVNDISPDTSKYALTARFPHGVPAVSDASMTEWMQYVYNQFPRPTNATGVDVTLSVIDSNGNFREIGKTTSDSDGFYSFQWIPDISGKFTVYASFAGSKSYWPSQAETAFAVDPAHPTEAPTATPTQSAADLYFVPAIAGLFVFVAIISVVLALLMLRKRP